MNNAGNLLLVDDDPSWLRLCATFLEAHGFSVVTASDPLIAMSLAMQMKSELTTAVVDYHMPLMNGSTLARCMKAICPELRVLLHSGDTSLELADMESIDAFVEKGNGVMVVVETLRDMKLSTGASTSRDSRTIPALHIAESELS